MKLVLLRHGESVWNKENRFTGWTDVDLSPKGISEAVEAGELLKANDFFFDIAFTSLLKRAQKTLELVLDQLGLTNVSIFKSWRLNERHYGALQGLNKAETAKKYGADQVAIWRRSYDIAPPPLKPDDKRFPGHDPLYKHIKPKDLPLSESLKDTELRFLPYWNDAIVPQLRKGRRAIIVAHGNSIRALIKYLEKVPDETIVKLEIPTGAPLVYEFDKNIKPVKSYYLKGL